MKKTYTYILLLEQASYYIGKTKTKDPKIRLRSHFQGKGSEATKKRKPIKLIEIFHGDCEKEMTLKYIEKYGKDKVKGYCWCQTDNW